MKKIIKIIAIIVIIIVIIISIPKPFNYTDKPEQKGCEDHFYGVLTSCDDFNYEGWCAGIIWPINEVRSSNGSNCTNIYRKKGTVCNGLEFFKKECIQL